MIFSSYINSQQMILMKQDVKLLQTHLKEFHDWFVNNRSNTNNNNFSESTLFASHEAMLQLYEIHSNYSASRRHGQLKMDTDIFNYIIQQYISAFAFSNKIEQDNSNIDISFVLFLCNVISKFIVQENDDEQTRIRKQELNLVRVVIGIQFN